MASKIKVDNINKVSDDSNIIKKCGTTITLGASGDSVALATGASQTGFGRTGTVDWVTTPKTATFTAESGKGYFCNTTGGAFEVDLPAGTAGDIISVQDYNNTFDDNNLTIDPNGSEKINGGVAGGPVVLNAEGEGVTLVYVDSTVGWRSVQDNEFADVASNYIAATGGNTIITCGDYKIHVFTSPGTFSVTGAGNACGSNSVEHLTVAGGGGGGDGSGSGGGGAGGYRQNYPSPTTGGIPVTLQSYPITVGAGGGASPAPTARGTIGNNSIFSSITSTGGGGGGSENPCVSGVRNGGAGGSGGGAMSTPGTGGAGNTPPVSPPQGNAGGDGGPSYGGGGGGGAGGTGNTGKTSGPAVGGVGSPIADAFFGPTAPSYGTPGPAPGRFFAGGGGGGCQTPSGTVTPGGSGGGGTGGKWGPPTVNATAGTDNTGGGGGGGVALSGAPDGNGGSGIVVIRYKYQ